MSVIQSVGVALKPKGAIVMVAKAAKKATRPKSKEIEPVAKKRLNRVHSMFADTSTVPKTIGERMSSRRLALQLTQADIAEQVVFAPRSGENQEERVLSRNAYCMYETGSVEPDLTKIEAIAKALKTTPQWLAFGTSEGTPIEAVAFDQNKKTFVRNGSCKLDEKWLHDKYEIESKDVILCLVSDYTGGFNSGDMAILRRDSAPTTGTGEYVFTYKSKMCIARIAKTPRSDSYRIFSDDLKKHDEVAAKNVNILGRVIGKIGDIAIS